MRQPNGYEPFGKNLEAIRKPERKTERKKKKRKTDRKKGRQKERKKEGISPYVSTMNAILLRMLSERYRSEHKYIYIDKIIGLFCKRAL